MTKQNPDPIFICKFEGGHETCTAVFCPPDKLDLAQGVMLARKAYTRLRATPPPPIVSARFEFQGQVLVSYDAAAIEAATAGARHE